MGPNGFVGADLVIELNCDAAHDIALVVPAIIKAMIAELSRLAWGREFGSVA